MSCRVCHKLEWVRAPVSPLALLGVVVATHPPLSLLRLPSAVSCLWRRATPTPIPNPSSVVLVEKKSSGRLYALKLLEKSRMSRQGAH